MKKRFSSFSSFLRTKLFLGFLRTKLFSGFRWKTLGTVLLGTSVFCVRMFGFRRPLSSLYFWYMRPPTATVQSMDETIFLEEGSECPEQESEGEIEETLTSGSVTPLETNQEPVRDLEEMVQTMTMDEYNDFVNETVLVRQCEFFQNSNTELRAEVRELTRNNKHLKEQVSWLQQHWQAVYLLNEQLVGQLTRAKVSKRAVFLRLRRTSKREKALRKDNQSLRQETQALRQESQSLRQETQWLRQERDPDRQATPEER